MSASRILMHIYAWTGLAIIVVGIAYTFVSPPQSLRTDRDGVPHFTPEVEHPITGEGVSVNELIRHYRGD
ncbi:hypothetical protein [Maritimibacter sp. HL-12]|uniref:hypothetical protein n=1 Tax=Maritimibacter sp. HL-12 TaxID=1162418 RepID=UPI000A0F23BE|nr:hypothetical protein [Maritimibacter sp. HL-12]SMH45636.1 hypothetical protein SAMN05661107_1628 [Maritimibacter sp. HL-12]